MKESYGQVLVGPPGSGKTSYCKTIIERYKNSRNIVAVNLDPANELGNGLFSIDVRELITVEYAMQNYDLGPNGGLLHCINFLVENKQWLMDRINSHEGSYFLFDCPGQLELYYCETSFKSLLDLLISYDYRLVAVNFIDCTFCTEPNTFISCVIDCLSTMLYLEMPQVNVLSKIDLLQDSVNLNLNGLEYLLASAELSLSRLEAITHQIVSVIEEYNLDAFCVSDVVLECDKGNGYIFGPDSEEKQESLFLNAFSDRSFERIENIKSKYLTDITD